MTVKRLIYPEKTETKDMHQYLLGSVSPRPIAFVSTKNEDGTDNLAPYSFFNAFSSNPPIVVFSSNRRVRDNTTKDTLKNVMREKEAVINMVNYDIVRQMSLTSVEYPEGVSEFAKSGLTPEPSMIVGASRVVESPVNMECRVKDIITLGAHGGAGHLVICEVLLMHISENVLDGDRIDPHKIDLMGRMGRSYYVRASGAAIHTIYQNVIKIPVGYDGLPASIRASEVLSANDIAELASVIDFPSDEEIRTLREQFQLKGLKDSEVHAKAKSLIQEERKEEALAVCLSSMLE